MTHLGDRPGLYRAFHGAAATAESLGRLAGSFHTVGGLSFDDLGAETALGRTHARVMVPGWR